MHVLISYFPGTKDALPTLNCYEEFSVKVPWGLDSVFPHKVRNSSRCEENPHRGHQMQSLRGIDPPGARITQNSSSVFH